MEYWGAVAGGGEEGAGELSSFLVISDVLKNVVDLPIDATERLVKNELDPVLKEAEGNIDKQVETELGSLESHLRGIGDVMKRLEEVHEDSGLLGDDFMEDLRSDVGVEEDPYYSVDLNSKSGG